MRTARSAASLLAAADHSLSRCNTPLTTQHTPLACVFACLSLVPRHCAAPPALLRAASASTSARASSSCWCTCRVAVSSSPKLANSVSGTRSAMYLRRTRGAHMAARRSAAHEQTAPVTAPRVRTCTRTQQRGRTTPCAPAGQVVAARVVCCVRGRHQDGQHDCARARLHERDRPGGERGQHAVDVALVGDARRNGAAQAGRHRDAPVHGAQERHNCDAIRDLAARGWARARVSSRSTAACVAAGCIAGRQAARAASSGAQLRPPGSWRRCRRPPPAARP